MELLLFRAPLLPYSNLTSVKNEISRPVGIFQGQIAKAFKDLLHQARGKEAPLACDSQSTSPNDLKELIAKDESHYFDDSLQVRM